MQSPKQTIKLLRDEVHGYLKDWMPNNDSLIKKELSIFDNMMSRRDFLKTASLAAVTAMVHQGCGSSGAPSQWDENLGSEGIVTAPDMASVTTPSNIVVDSDVHGSFTTYNPLPSYGSSDATHIQNHGILESFNPHLMTVNSESDLTTVGLSIPDRTFGIPEHIHLIKNIDSNNNKKDYTLNIYEKSNDGHHGLKETEVTLDGTSSQNYNQMVTANGTFHNKILEAEVYSQKMALLTNIGQEYEYGDTTQKSLQLFYQQDKHNILEPGVELKQDTTWESIDLIVEFKNNETHNFNKYKILEVDTYHDGHHHSFIYGTISFENNDSEGYLYNYGFVVTFNNITDIKPSITFFAPNFMSVNDAETISGLIESYTDSIKYHYTADPLEKLAIFSQNRFIPFSQSLNANGKIDTDIYFTFTSFNIAHRHIISKHEDGKYHFSFDELHNLDSTHINRYMIKVDTTCKIDYLLKDFKPKISFTINTEYHKLDFTFNTTSISVADLWQSVYNLQENQLDTFVRSIKNDGTNLEIITASSYYDTTSFKLGVLHRYNTINLDTKSVSSSSSVTSFEDGTDKTKDYKSLWFDTMKSHLQNSDGTDPDSMYECVYNNNGMQSVDFHCTHNQQGVLRSYFIIRSASGGSYLIGFNEKGDESNGKFSSQSHETLKNQIINKSTTHNPPMPVAINPYKLHNWHGISGDGEVLYSSARHYVIDETDEDDKQSRELVVNTTNNNLGYMHASSNLTDKSWNLKEEQIKIDSGDEKVTTHSVKRDMHQVHLQVTNNYRHPVSLHKTDYSVYQKQVEEGNMNESDLNQIQAQDPNLNIYVEVRFNKRLTIKSHTDPSSVKTYHPGVNKSIFLPTDPSGKISLEIDAGAKNDQYNGAMMEYRLVDKSKVSNSTNTALAIVDVDGDTTDFKSCNISFRMYQRLSSDNYDTKKPGIKSAYAKAKTGLDDKIDASYTSVIGGAYKSVLTNDSIYRSNNEVVNIAPDNDAPLVKISRVYRKELFDKTRTVPRSKSYLPITRSWYSHTSFKAIHWIRHTVHSAINIENEILQKAKGAAKALANDISSIADTIVSDEIGAIEDIAATIETLYDDVKSFAEMLWNFIMASLDFEIAFDMGQEMKQFRIDQLKPIGYTGDDGTSKNTTNKHNAYTILQSAEDMVTHISDDMIEVMTKPMDALDRVSDEVFSKIDSHKNTHDSDQKNKQDQSTIITHIANQISRLIEFFKINKLIDYVDKTIDEIKTEANHLMNDIFGVTLDDMLSGSFPKYIEDNLFDFFGIDTKEDLIKAIEYLPGISEGEDPAPNSLIRKIENNITLAKDATVNFASGSTDAVTMLDSVKTSTENLQNLLKDKLKDLSKLIPNLPTQFLNDDKILSFMTHSGSWLKKLLEPFGLLFFMKKDKFKNVEDLATFIMGFSLAIGPILAQSVIEKANEVLNTDIDFTKLFSAADDGVRNIFNKLMNLAGNTIESILEKATLESITLEMGELGLKGLGVILKVIGTIFSGISTLFSALNLIPIKKPITDALSSVFDIFSGMISLMQIPIEVLMIPLELAKLDALALTATISNVIANSIVYSLDFLEKVFLAIDSSTQVQPAENNVYDPARFAILAVGCHVISGAFKATFKDIASGFHIIKLGISVGTEGIDNLLEDATAATSVIGELVQNFLFKVAFILDATQMILGYIDKSTLAEAIAAIETVGIAVAYVIAVFGYYGIFVLSKIVSGIDSIGDFVLKIDEVIAMKV